MRPLLGTLGALILVLGLFAPLLDANGSAGEASASEEESFRLPAAPEIEPRPLDLPLDALLGMPARPVLEVQSSLIDESILRKHLRFQDSLSAP